MNDSRQSERNTVNRRQFIKAGTTVTVVGSATTKMDSTTAQEDNENKSIGSDPFTLGIASGDPLPDSVVLWTRLAPEPLQADGGMPNRQVPVNWKVATDERMRNIVKDGATQARPEYGHSVHVEPEGLNPNTEYYYQFRVGSARSPVGRTKTAPAADSSVDEFNFAYTSCQRYPAGHYTTHQHLAQEDLDVVFHLGDYIYEDDGQGSLNRGHEPPRECQSLDDYRIRYAQYKTDPDLQASHAAFPWIVTWDDHEVVNNYADENDGAPPEEFLKRRAAAYQAYWEHQPLRRSRMPDGPDMPLYRRFTFGNLAQFNVLDTRQYRDEQTKSSEEAKDPDRTILGNEQEQWLLDGLDSSSSRWNVLANQAPFAARDNDADPHNVDFGGGDKWDGYRADRYTLLDFMTEHPDLNPVVITGDVHNNAVYDLKADFSNPDSQTVGTEYIGTSVSSAGDANVRTTFGDSFGERENTPWRKFWNNNRGYVRCTLTPEEWRTDYRVVSAVEEPTASVNTLASFLTEDKTPGAKQTTASVDFQIPDSYGSASDPSVPFEIGAVFANPGGADAEDITMENVELNVVGLPDDWSITATTPTEFETVANGESVTVTWEVNPSPVADVQFELEVTYEIDGEGYRHVFQGQMSEPQVAYWRFENNTEDSSSYEHAFSLGNGAGYDDQVAIEGNYSLALDGDDDYIRITDTEDGFLHSSFSERTVSMWVKPDSTTGTQDLFTEGGSKNGLAFRINDDTLEAGVASNWNFAGLTSPLTQTSWTHIAVVFDHGDFELHVDGNEVASKTNVGFEHVPNHSSEGAIGRAGGSSYAFTGTGDNFGGHVDATAIYGSALPAEKISELANRKQTIANVGVQAPDLYDASESFEIDATFTNPEGPKAEDVTMENVSLTIEKLPADWSITATTPTEFETVANGETISVTWDINPSPAGDVQLELKVVYEIEGKSYQHIIPEQMGEPRIAYWQFENNTEDSSSYEHTFSLRNGAGYDDQVAIEGNYSLALDGDDDYIRISSDEFLYDAFTERSVSMWVKPDSTTGTQDLFTEGGSKNGLAFRINDDTLEAGVASDWNFASINYPFTRTDWTHVAVVFERGAFRLYVDGSEVVSKSDVGFETVLSHSNEGAIGRAGGGSYAFTGTGDNFGGHVDATAIYRSALSPEKITYLSNKF